MKTVEIIQFWVSVWKENQTKIYSTFSEINKCWKNDITFNFQMLFI